VKEIKGNLWDYFGEDGKLSQWKPENAKFVVLITTNGTIKKNGEAVMGRGCAAEAKKLMPSLPADLGSHIRERGNIVMQPMGGDDAYEEACLWTFPVKHNWWEKADLELIRKSALRLKTIAKNSKGFTFILPRPGCGNGGLRWKDVKVVLEEVKLPRNVWVIHR
jgi:hypothetical protein